MKKNFRPTIFQLFEAVKKNVCAPDEEEAARFIVPRKLMTSAVREGNAEVGLILFVGIASSYGFSDDDIMSAVSMEGDEVEFKKNEYKKVIAAGKFEGRRMHHKTRLINNYLRIVYGIRK